ncbi:hypothetical protein [Herminiimonas sp. CN]|uniref:hypothetical protein n=1 Tax=Herminiimonas sp. CN TaxID=1349818 RepID=UPI0012DBF876|nr:hypothetical protein [Herminiimonas sp. CN]
MQISRRSILKSMMAGSTLAAYGLPRFAFAASAGPAAPIAPREIMLLTAGTTDRFGLGVQAAGAADSIAFGNSLPDAGALLRMFSSVRGKRLVGLMSDAAYVLFSELARDAGVVQMIEGRHMVSADGSSGTHALHSVPGFHGTAQSLATALAPGHAAFAITEVPLGGSGRALRGVDWSSLGFASFRVAGAAPQDETWLHLSGLDIWQGCDALGVDPAQAEALRCWRTVAAPDSSASLGWEQTLGQALAGLAAGGISNSAPCVNQAFIHQLLSHEDGARHNSYVSFVMEA